MTVTTTKVEMSAERVLTEPMYSPRVVHVDTEDYNLVVVYVEHAVGDDVRPEDVRRLWLHVVKPGTVVQPPLGFAGATKTHLNRLWFVYVSDGQ